MTEPTRTANVVVIGAGVAGLVAARELHRKGIDVLVLESADRVGGRTMATTTALGSRVDLGGQWIGHGHHRFETLARELGTTIYPMHTPRMPAVLDGAVTVRPWSLVAAQAVLLRWQVAVRFGTPRRWASMSVQDWLRRVPGRARRVLEVVVSVMTTADLDRLSMHAFIDVVRHQGGFTTMLRTAGGAQDSLIVEGAGSLAERMAAELGPRVLLDSAVVALHRDEAGVDVHTAAGVVRAATVIVTAPPPMAAKISHEPPLPPARTDLERGTYMGSVYKALAVYDRPFWREHTDAEAILVGEPGTGVFDSSPPDGPGHLCFLVAGPEARALDGLDTAARRAALLDPLVRRLGAAVASPLDWLEKSWHLDEHAGGGYLALRDFGSTDGSLPMPADPVGRIRWAGTETAREHAGYIEGAIESGHRAAREVLAGLSGPADRADRRIT